MSALDGTKLINSTKCLSCRIYFKAATFSKYSLFSLGHTLKHYNGFSGCNIFNASVTNKKNVQLRLIALSFNIS